MGVSEMGHTIQITISGWENHEQSEIRSGLWGACFLSAMSPTYDWNSINIQDRALVVVATYAALAPSMVCPHQRHQCIRCPYWECVRGFISRTPWLAWCHWWMFESKTCWREDQGKEKEQSKSERHTEQFFHYIIVPLKKWRAHFVGLLVYTIML